MSAVRNILVIAHLTLHEAARRRILLAALCCGVAFLIIYGIGYSLIYAGVQRNEPAFQQRFFLNFFTMAGLYVVNFLMVLAAVFTPVDTLSGEIASGTMQTLASKPIRRSEIVLGKWIGFWVMIAGYLALMAGGVLLIARLIAGFTPPNVHIGLSLMLLESTVLLSLSIAGGTRFSTITNGVLVFGLYGLAFIGGWIEQIGTLTGNPTARSIGTAASLLMPTEALWQLGAWHMQFSMMRDLHMTPFSPASVASPMMVAWAGGYAIAVLLLAVHGLRKRQL
jgi:ABC-type transport system involved in multi-copper enzyme maturation permease subunit